MYADYNVIHFCVGNTSPSVYEKDGILYFGSDDYNDESDTNIPLVKDGNYIGRISTTVWWVTGCDWDWYEQLAIKMFGEEKGKQLAKKAEENSDIIVRVEPGHYKLRYLLENENEEYLDATLTKIG